MTNNKISNKAVIYLRVSSKGQEEHGYSLDAQEKMAQEYASRHGLEVVKIWKGAESAWGREERSNFSAMLSFVKKHTEVQHVIFDVLDRMTRNDMDKINFGSVYDFDLEKLLCSQGFPEGFSEDLNNVLGKSRIMTQNTNQ